MATSRKKDLAYYLTLFKIEGHTTWRAHLAQTPGAFDEQVATLTNVTQKQQLRIDRLSGTFSA